MAAVPGVAELLSRVGYRTISWSMATDDFHAHGRAGIEKLVLATHKHGMAVSEINVELDMVTLDADVRSATATFFKEVIQAVAEGGISTIKTYTGPIPWIPNALRIPDDITEGDAWVSVSSILQEVLPTAEQHNVSINIEAVSGISVMTITPLTASSGCLWHISRISAAISKQTMNSTALLFGRRG
ncbi:MAG: TIM barrel protein [Gemmatimonadota bacterium]|nr:TIM barrel protein [Gemmatimonadota bacterium]